MRTLQQPVRTFLSPTVASFVFMTVASFLFTTLSTTFTWTVSKTKARTMADLPPLLGLTIEKAAEGLQSGRFTSLDLTRAYLARIEEASEFKAVLQVNLDAVATSLRLDEERARSGSRGYVGPSSCASGLFVANSTSNETVDLCMAFQFSSRTIS